MHGLADTILMGNCHSMWALPCPGAKICACCRSSERFSVRWQRGASTTSSKLRQSAPAPLAASKSRDVPSNPGRPRDSTPHSAKPRDAPYAAKPRDAALETPRAEALLAASAPMTNPMQSMPEYESDAYPQPGLNGIRRASSFTGRMSRSQPMEGERLLATEGDAGFWLEGPEIQPSMTGLKVGTQIIGEGAQMFCALTALKSPSAAVSMQSLSRPGGPQAQLLGHKPANELASTFPGTLDGSAANLKSFDESRSSL